MMINMGAALQAGSEELILASASPSRAAILKKAGLRFAIEPAGLDEAALSAPLKESDADASDIALVLAQAKAVEVSSHHPSTYVIGADQVLELEGTLFEKPPTMREAREHLLRLRGRIHELHTAVALVRDGAVDWVDTGTARMTMRDFSPEFLGTYLAEAGPAILQSVGAYQLEGVGAHLFERIEGDFFTILGLPLLPLLAELRRRDVVMV